MLPPGWNGAASYIHWQGRLLDEARSTGLRRVQRDGGQILQAERGLRCALLSRKWDVFCSSSSRGVARALLLAQKLWCGACQVEMRSRYSCDTVSGRLPRRIGEVVEKVEGEFWKMFGGDCYKKWRRGREATIVGKKVTQALGEHLQHGAKSRQLNDWPDSPRGLTKQSAATAPLSALTKAGLDPGYKVPTNLGNPSTWVLGPLEVLGPWPLQTVAH